MMLAADDSSNDGDQQNNLLFQNKPFNPLSKKCLGLNQFDDNISCWSESQRESHPHIDLKNLSFQTKEENGIGNSSSQEYPLFIDIKGIQEQIQEIKVVNVSASPLRLQQQYKFDPINIHKNSSRSSIHALNKQLSIQQGKRTEQIDQSNQNNRNANRSIFDSELRRGQTVSVTHQYSEAQMRIFCFYSQIKMRMLLFQKFFTLSGRTSLLNRKIRQIISDLSDYQKDKNKKRTFYHLASKFHFIQQCLHWIEGLKLPQLKVQDSAGFILLLFFNFLTCSLLYIYSILIVYQSDESIISLLMDCLKPLWVLEFLFKMYRKFIKMVDRESCQVKCFKYIYIFEVLPLIAVFVQSKFSDYVSIKLLIFIKLISCFRDQKLIQKRLCMVMKKYFLIQILNLFITLFLIGHCIGCLWFLIGQVEVKYFGENETWVDSLKQEDQAWWKIYIWSYYWALTLMTTGSNIASTVTQACFTSVIMLFITISFGYILNVIGLILEEMDKTALQKRKDISFINEYMRQRNITKGLQAKVNENLSHFYKKSNQIKQDSNHEALNKISQNLQDEIQKEYNKQIFSKISILKKHFSEKSLEELSLYMKEEYYMPHQTIFKGDASHEFSMMYIVSGQVEVFNIDFNEHKKNKCIRKHGSGDIFGQAQFFTGLRESYIYRSDGFTKLVKIGRADFIEIIRKNEIDYEIFCQIKDKIQFYQDNREINLFCDICRNSNHSTLECPLTHFDKSRAIKLIGAKQSLQESRKSLSRPPSTKIKSIRLQKFLLASIKEYREYQNQNLFYIDQNWKIEYDDQDTGSSSNNNTSSDEQDEQIYRVDGNKCSILKNEESTKQISQHPQTLEDICLPQKSYLQNDTIIIGNLTEPLLFLQKFNQNLEEGQERPENCKSNQQLKELQEFAQSNSIHDIQPTKLHFVEFASLEPKKSSARDIMDKSRTINQQELIRESNECSFKNIGYCKSTSKPLRQSMQAVSNDLDDQKIKMQRNSKKDFKKQKRSMKKSDIMKGSIDVRQTQFNSSQFIRFQQFMNKYNNTHSQGVQVDNPWGFDMLKDFSFYFPEGNSKNRILEFARFIKNKRKQSKIQFYKRAQNTVFQSCRFQSQSNEKAQSSNIPKKASER